MPASPNGDSFSPDQAEILLKANYHNLVKMVQSGRTLSAGEVSLLQSIQGGGRPEAKTFATSQTELADGLGVSRWTIQRAMKVEDLLQGRR